MVMEFVKKIQIKAKSFAQVEAQLFGKAFIIVLAKFFDYSNIFLIENAAKFSEHIKLNKYAIEQKEGKQSLFRLIYSLGLVELKILKPYIKTNLANDLI